ncbi:MAG: LptA/OstA family protein [Rhodobacteraceae bacterium]|nr:LptA/OstA family protein [Paracoccaceae bacterium]
MNRLKTLLILAIGTVLSGGALAQDNTIAFGPAGYDAKAAIEIISDAFSISQDRNTAEFSGNVVVGQGDMRLSAGNILVEYTPGEGDEQGRIARMIASGGVTLAAGSEAAEADRAVYEVEARRIVLEGDVLLTQGANALAGQKAVIDLADGSARFEGRVKTVFRTGGSE